MYFVCKEDKMFIWIHIFLQKRKGKPCQKDFWGIYDLTLIASWLLLNLLNYTLSFFSIVKGQTSSPTFQWSSGTPPVPSTYFLSIFKEFPLWPTLQWSKKRPCSLYTKFEAKTSSKWSGFEFPI